MNLRQSTHHRLVKGMGISHSSQIAIAVLNYHHSGEQYINNSTHRNQQRGGNEPEKKKAVEITMDGDAAAPPAAPEHASARLSVDLAAVGAEASPSASPVSVASSSAENGRVVAEEDAVAEERLRVRLKMLDEHVFEVDAAPETTVAAFRELVARVTQVPPPRQRLIYRGSSRSKHCFSTREVVE